MGRAFARASRLRIAEQVVDVLGEVCNAPADWSTYIDADHNHVQAETHDNQALWIHRKGAQSAQEGEAGVIPGSMGSDSYHVVGRGQTRSLCSSSHGAGRVMSRTEARKRISKERLIEDTKGVWFDRRLVRKLVEEAPAAYKDISRVMRAQRPLTRIVRRLRPLVSFKGG